jgi:aspartyl-tRNA(Asn)/glutamyl-tRNA(Gln) amidotransferase subunit C
VVFYSETITFVDMEVTDQLVENLADLSRLKFNEREKAEIRKDLQKMISFVEKLNEVDTSGVPPLLHMSEVTNVYREDAVQGSMLKGEALANAPVADTHYFKVPKVIKK